MQFQLKDFLKRCKAASFSKKVKQVLEKTVANAKFIETRRKNVSFGVGDKTAIQAWEAQVTRDGTPLLAFYKSWKKVADVQQAKKVADQEMALRCWRSTRVGRRWRMYSKPKRW